MFLSQPRLLPSKLRCGRWNGHRINVRTACERYAPVRHRAFRIEFRGLLKRAYRCAMIESVEKAEALIEIALCFRRLGRDLARMGTEAVVKWLFRGKQLKAGQRQHRPDNDMEGLGLRFHKWLRQNIRGIFAGNS